MSRKVLVIVVVYNGMQWLERCLSSVAGSADLYVWDNDSTDGSADFVASRFPQAKLVRSAVNLGFSKPNNMGMQYALEHGYDCVYLLNQDAWLAEDTLEKLLEASEASPDYAVLSPVQMTEGFLAVDKLFQKDKTPPAAHWLVPVAAIRKLGLFNEELFPFWGQDDDWCNRARYFGFKVGVVPEARAVHDRARRTEDKERLMSRNYYTGSLVRLCDVNRPLWERFAFVCLFTLVKAVKYRSLRVFALWWRLCHDLPQVKACRLRVQRAR